MKYYNKTWYQNGCPHISIEDAHYIENKESIFGFDFSVHDGKSISRTSIERGEKFILHIDSSHSTGNVLSISFYDYIIKEKCEMYEKYIIADELYRYDNNRYEYHLLLQSFIKGKMQLEHFTINCKSITIETSK